jgi:aspartyl-tRNA(Asn)/glutamyl-tRNA(Gln) amidotransferase subunit A
MIHELRKSLDQKEISVLELTEQYFQRIESHTSLNAYITLTRDLALKQAALAQERISKGQAAALTGIPLSIKDNICTKDARTTSASHILENYRPPYNATVVERILSQDCVILGKTNMDEFAMGGSTRTSFFGPTLNPFDLNRVPGGSSGGSASAVSANLCVASLGSDTGGSIRQPAAFCGVTGLKPTYGTVSRYGLIAYASSLDQIGPIALSARDCAILLEAIASKDPNDMTSTGPQSTSYSGKIGMSLKGLKIGVISELMGDGIDPEVLSGIEKAIEFFKEEGATIVPIALPELKVAIPAYYLISSAEASANLARLDGVKYGSRADCPNGDYEDLIMKSRAEGFGREVKRRILLGTYALCSGYYDAYYGKATALQARIRSRMEDALTQVDVLLSPTAPTTAFGLNENQEDPTQMYVSDICTVSANLAGLPGISTPCGYDNKGLPIGLMLTGRRFDEETIIAVTDCFEQTFTRRNPVTAL